MELIEHYHYISAITIARVFLGLLFVFQGYDAAFHIGLRKVADTYHETFIQKKIPRLLTVFSAWFTVYTELICGLLLIFGLFEFAALYLLGINLIVAALGFGINEPLWNMRNVFPRLVILLFLLTTPLEWHCWSMDSLFFKS